MLWEFLAPSTVTVGSSYPLVIVIATAVWSFCYLQRVISLLVINLNPGCNYYHLFIGLVILFERDLSDLLLLLCYCCREVHHHCRSYYLVIQIQKKNTLIVFTPWRSGNFSDIVGVSLSFDIGFWVAHGAFKFVQWLIIVLLTRKLSVCPHFIW